MGKEIKIERNPEKGKKRDGLKDLFDRPLTLSDRIMAPPGLGPAESE